ncbi:MAG: S-methyl-5'-thioadenosine phosphorylase [Leptospirales bacterium]|nr:S-methyl-5'-thioadenosine phosphorylase [Leptospirales bacterium]
MAQASIGVIGGSGIYDLEGLKKEGELRPETPWGLPSDAITLGEFAGQKLAFLPRHGRGHFLAPHQVPFRANVAALKMLGVEQIVAFSAVGSLREEIPPRDFVLPSQIIDRTKGLRPATYFEDGIVAHAAFGDPFSKSMADAIESQKDVLQKVQLHRDRTLVCMEGPAFSTRAESMMYRQWGGDIINMSVLPEAKLARELEIDYQMICMSTDYDAWRPHEDSVTVEEIIHILHDNADNARRLLAAVLPRLSAQSSLKGSMKFAIITAPELRKGAQAQKLKRVLPEYF